MSSSIDISIISTFNDDQFIEDMVQSVLQKGDFFGELILVNAQVQKSKKVWVMKRPIPKNWQIQLIEEKDNSMYEGISKGFGKAKGDIITYLNIDDKYQDSALSTVIDIFRNSPKINWLVGKTAHMNFNGQNIYVGKSIRYISSLIGMGCYGQFLPYIHQESTFFRRSLLSEVDLGQFANYTYAGDFFLWKNFAKTNRLYAVNTILSMSRRHADQKSVVQRHAYVSEFNQIKNSFSIVAFPKLIWELICLYIIPFGLLKWLYPKYFVLYNLKDKIWQISTL